MGHEKVYCSPLFAVLLFPISRNKGTDGNWRCRGLLHRAPPPTGNLAGPHCFMQKQPYRGDVVLWKGRPDKKPSKPPATWHRSFRRRGAAGCCTAERSAGTAWVQGTTTSSSAVLEGRKGSCVLFMQQLNPSWILSHSPGWMRVQTYIIEWSLQEL